jgi:hypothetical protein
VCAKSGATPDFTVRRLFHPEYSVASLSIIQAARGQMRSTRPVRQRRFEISNLNFEIRKEQDGLSLFCFPGIINRSDNQFAKGVKPQKASNHSIV